MTTVYVVARLVAAVGAGLGVGMFAWMALAAAKERTSA